MSFFTVDGFSSSGGNGNSSKRLSNERFERLSPRLGQEKAASGDEGNIVPSISPGYPSDHTSTGVHLDLNEPTNIGDREDDEYERY